MAFGQPRGYPASPKQLSRLEDLLLAAGHTDFRDARGPLGLTQRQAGGKFTRDEADELIAVLEAEAEGVVEGGVSPEAAAPEHPVNRRRTSPPSALARVPAEDLAAELQRRGWVVMEP
jgi:hypothetical protein